MIKTLIDSNPPVNYEMHVYKNNEAAIKCYKKNGFEIVGEYDPDSYVMARVL